MKVALDEYANSCFNEFIEAIPNQRVEIHNSYSKFKSVKDIISLHESNTDSIPEIDSGFLLLALNIINMAIILKDKKLLHATLHHLYRLSENGAVLLYTLSEFNWCGAASNLNDMMNIYSKDILNVINTGEVGYSDFIILFAFSILYEIMAIDNLNIVSDKHNMSAILLNLNRKIQNKENVQFVIEILNKNVINFEEAYHEHNGYNF